jgi:hypothetical protein
LGTDLDATELLGATALVSMTILAIAYVSGEPGLGVAGDH